MLRIVALVVTVYRFIAASPIDADDRLIPLFTGTFADATYRTTVDLRSSTIETCRFDLRASHGDPIHSIVTVEAGVPLVLDEFAAELRSLATTVRVSCTGSVDVHSRLHSSRDGGRTYDEGPLFRAVAPSPLAADQRIALPVAGDFILAEVAGAPVNVAARITATALNRVSDRQYDLEPLGQRMVEMADVLRSLGPINAQFVVSGNGRIVVFQAANDVSLADRARRPPDHVRAGLNDTAARSTADPAAGETALISQPLLVSPFKAAPFREPATGLVYIRDRWYDPSTGTFLTPDRAGYRDSSNLYSYGKGDPVNTNDPTGMYIDEQRILNSPLAKRYTAWRDDFRSSPLGREAWDRIHAIPASRFTLTMEPLPVSRGDQTGAVATRRYDPAGNYIGGSIAFARSFGTTPPADTTANRLQYPRAFEVESTVIFSRRRYEVYSFGHEFGHILSGFDPAQAVDAFRFSQVQAQQTQLGAEIQPLVQKRQRTGLTPAEAQLLQTLVAQQQQLDPLANALKLTSEQYGDALGYQFFRSWNLGHRRIFERPNGSPPPALPPGALPPP